MDINDIDLSEMRAVRTRRRGAVAAVLARMDPTGMTRPARVSAWMGQPHHAAAAGRV